MIPESVLRQLPLPNLVLDLDALDENCRKIATLSNGKRIRIATKSIRSVPVLKRIIESDPIFQGVMCFSPHEAIFLANHGFSDILLGYPCWDKDAISHIASLNRDGHSIILMIDSLEHVSHLQQIAAETNGIIRVCIDIDMSSTYASFHFGVRRSPLRTPKEVLELVQFISDSTELIWEGIMGYEAQIAGVGNNVPSQKIKNMIVTILQNKSIVEVASRRKMIVDLLQEKGFKPNLVNGGGTGSLATTSAENAITEVTVGSAFFAPLLFDYYKNFAYQPSLFFALPVVRIPFESIYTCLGGGYVASGSAGNDKLPQPIWPKNSQLMPLEAVGEVQTPVICRETILEIGDPILFRAAKAGEICERFLEMKCVADGEIVGSYSTYRGDGVCFL